MKWTKKGRIFDPQNNASGWIKSYAAVPVADLIDDETLRIYFATRDEKGRSLPTFLETDPSAPENIKYIHSAPILPLGNLGTFDDNGIMPSCIVNVGARKLLYYIGWNPQITVPYRNSIGLAESFDNGKTFQRLFQGPISDRNKEEPFFTTSPFVIRENSANWKMWYSNCTGWKIIKGRPEAAYNIKIARSTDGINWQKSVHTCIDYDDFTEAIAQPCIYTENGAYKMIYSYRQMANYKTDRNKSYRLGYAESNDGIIWIRKDDEIGIKFSDEGWDSQMQEYATTYFHKGKRYLIYNGNGFGETGFGYAVQEQA